MRLRLFLSYTLVILVATVMVALIASQSTATEVRGFMFRGGMTGVDDLEDALVTYYVETGSWQGVESLLRMPGPGTSSGGSRWGNPAGRGFGSAAAMNQRLRLYDSSGSLVMDTAGTADRSSVSPEDLERSTALTAGGEIIGYLLPEGGVAFSSQDEQALLNRLNRAALIAGLVAAGLALPLALLLSYRMLRPIRELTKAALRMAEGDMNQRVTVRGDDELAVLGRTFNHMAGSLQQAGESRRAMTADIAHELRNPLAVQRAHLEALQDGIYPLDTENLTPILEQNHLLTRLVEDLRTLALAESGQLTLERVPSNFAELIANVTNRFTPQVDAQDIHLSCEIDERCPQIPIDPGRIEQILGNLLSNALRHTPAQGQIHIKLTCDQKTARLSIHDSGSGIPAEALPHIFERFYRADRARSRSEGGTGLGLSIARQLAEAHGGELTAANHPEGGAVFTLVLPVSS